MSNFYSSATPSITRGLPDEVRALGHPDEVLAHSGLTGAEKREILAAWASDDHSVRDAPSLRQLDSGAVVSVDELLRALRSLDMADIGQPPVSYARKSKRRHRSMRSRQRVFVKRRDDDDEPPTSPAAACPLGVALAHHRRWEEGLGSAPAAA